MIKSMWERNYFQMARTCGRSNGRGIACRTCKDEGAVIVGIKIMCDTKGQYLKNLEGLTQILQFLI